MLFDSILNLIIFQFKRWWERSLLAPYIALTFIIVSSACYQEYN